MAVFATEAEAELGPLVVIRALGRWYLARTFHTPVAADVSRRCLAGDKDAPTHVGGYTLQANRVGRANSRLCPLQPALKDYPDRSGNLLRRKNCG